LNPMAGASCAKPCAIVENFTPKKYKILLTVCAWGCIIKIR